jgi:hypothetical protein
MRMSMLAATLSVLATGLIAASQPAMAAPAASTFPKFDVEHNCKIETAQPTDVGETMDRCVNDELRAQNELQPKWSSYSSADQATCIRQVGVATTPSYLELKICLEMTHDNELARQASNRQ